MKTYTPDYRRITDAAYKKKTDRIPLYEHDINYHVAEQIIGKPLSELREGDYRDKREYFRYYVQFCRDYGYDVVPYEGCVVECIQGGEGLCNRVPGIIRTMEDIERYPWEALPDRYFARFDPFFQALEAEMLPGMKAVAGIGNGVFEIVQDFVPLSELALLEIDEPEVFSLLWEKAGDLLISLWSEFFPRYGDLYSLCRFGDDLGFKSSTLVSPETIRTHILPQYRRIVSLIHSKGKPALLHCCGNIFEVMDDIIDTGIDAKHSNEDTIAPFSVWLEKYGNRIGNFGGVEMNVLCLNTEQEIKEYVKDVLRTASAYPGVAIGSGNQIAEYIPPEGFIAMVEAVREYRGD